MTDHQQIALERVCRLIVLRLYALQASRAWRSLRAEKQEKTWREADIAACHQAIRTIRRRIRRKQHD